MNKSIFKTLVAVLAFASFTFVACKDDDDPVEEKTIAELAQGNADLSSLVAALDRAGLTSVFTGTTEYTVFAPTNAAFTAFLQANNFATLNDVPVDVLKQVLQYHVVAGEAKAASLSTGYVSTLATFGTTTSNLSLFVNTTGGVTLNKDVKVVTADVDAKNGVVHVVDKVIALPTIVTAATSNPNFSTLVAALTRADLGVNYVEILSGAGPFTVFAPTNDAFTALLAELNVANLNAIPADLLNKVLQYHVVAGANVRSSQLTDEQVVTTFQTGTFKVDLTGGTKIVDARGRIANIIAVDVQNSNGVVHAIDKVILPQQ